MSANELDARIREIKQILGCLGPQIHDAKLRTPKGYWKGKCCRKNPHFRSWETAKHLPFELRQEHERLTRELADLQDRARRRHAHQAPATPRQGLPTIKLQRYSWSFDGESGLLHVNYGTRAHEMPPMNGRVVVKSEKEKAIGLITAREKGSLAITLD